MEKEDAGYEAAITLFRRGLYASMTPQIRIACHEGFIFPLAAADDYWRAQLAEASSIATALHDIALTAFSI